MPIVQFSLALTQEFNTRSLKNDVHNALRDDPTVGAAGTMILISKMDDWSIGAEKPEGAEEEQAVFIEINFKHSELDKGGKQINRTPEQEEALLDKVFDAAVNNLKAQGIQNVSVHFVAHKFDRENGIRSVKLPKIEAAPSQP